MSLRVCLSACCAAMLCLSVSMPVSAQVVPGTGQRLAGYGDNFEDANWKFVHNFPKSSKEQDEQIRHPRGYSTNKLWFESAKRGQPDNIVIVPTPPGGLPGSTRAMQISSVNTGIPGRVSFDQQQDDLLMNGRRLPVSYNPSCVARVYIPPFDEWEDRSGVSFGIRADVHTTVWSDEEKERRGKRRGLFDRLSRHKVQEPYWPGMFIALFRSEDNGTGADFAQILVRGDEYGREVGGPKITEPGWWTFGMSCTSDGRIHFYASPGVDDLTQADLITSQFPYSYKAESFTTMFFNVVNKYDGKTESTKWIIDDPALYYANGKMAGGGGVRR